jgi:hypothetical protein
MKIAARIGYSSQFLRWHWFVATLQSKFSYNAMMSSNSPNILFNRAESSGKKILSITDNVTKEMITGIINKCVENEHIDDDSKIIISIVLLSINFHHDAYSPKKKVSPLVYHNPKIEKGIIY